MRGRQCVVARAGIVEVESASVGAKTSEGDYPHHWLVRSISFKGSSNDVSRRVSGVVLEGFGRVVDIGEDEAVDLKALRIGCGRVGIWPYENGNVGGSGREAIGT